MTTAGARFGPYEIVELLGAGGMAAVYRAKDGELGRSPTPSERAGSAEFQIPS
jgi:hypothetical protein